MAREAPIFIGPRWAHAALLIVIAMALTYPYMRRGLPFGGHDTPTHVSYQHFFDEQIAQGDWYPRWMPGLNQGLGGGIFFVQYPLPYYVAWALGKIVPNHWGIYLETRTQGLALTLATILAALFTYAWCANFSDRLTAMLAAIIYLSLPYFLTIDLYMRVAVGELWALSFLPLSFFFIERMAAGSGRAVPGLAVAFALVIVSHLFTAVLLAPVLLAYSVWRVERGRRVQAAGQTLAGLVLATGLAGVYTLPFLYHRRFLHPDNSIQAYGANYSPLSQMFSYNAVSFSSPTHGPLWRHFEVAARVIAVAIAAYVGVIWFRSGRERASMLRFVLACVSILALVRAASAGYVYSTGEVPGALPLSWNLIQQRAQIFLYSFLTLEAALVCYWSIRSPRNRRLANFLVVLALASYVMMTSWSQIVWKVLHFLWYIQFPWRLNAFLVVATAGLAALAISELRRASLRRGLAGALVAFTLWGLVAVLSAGTGYVSRVFRSAKLYQFVGGMDSGLPIYAQVDPKQAIRVRPPGDQKIHVTLERGSGFAAVASVQPRSIKLEAYCETDCTLQIGQFYYPGWRVRTVPGNVELHAGSPGGLMELSAPAGTHHLLLELPYSWSERLGAWLSLACLLLVLIAVIKGAPFRSVERFIAPGC